MKENYKLSPKAEDSLYRIWLYGCEQWGVAKADRYYDALFERFEEIATNPLMYPSADDTCKGYRRRVCGKESVFYQIRGQTVEIMDIIGQQDTSVLGR